MQEKNKVPGFVFLAALAMSLLGHGGVSLAASDWTVEKVIEIYDAEADVRGAFKEEIVEGDIKYKLQEVQTEALEPRAEQEERMVTVQEPLYDVQSGEERVPSDVIEQEGIRYYLQEYRVTQDEAVERTISGKAEVLYEGIEYVTEIPETGPVVITDALTGERYKKTMPRTAYQIEAERWVDDFTFPVKIYSYDAESYMLGDVEVPKHADLSQYGQEFLKILELDPQCYQVNSITLSGEAYDLDGELVQEATAFGSRKVFDVMAVYEGSMTLEGEPEPYYECIYTTADPAETKRALYTVKAKAVYKAVTMEETEAEAPLPWWGKMIGFLTEPVTMTVAMFLFLLLIILVVSRLEHRKKTRLEKHPRVGK